MLQERAMARVTRFQVMAVLQAARARALGLDINEAKSWGLNRAVFYAAAKRGWENAKAVGARRPIIAELDRDRNSKELEYVLGGEKAYLCPDPKYGLRFMFGGEVQSPEAFDRQVKRRFDDWDRAWEEAREIIDSSPAADLESQHRFFDHVYKPRRDALAAKWSEYEKPRRKSAKAA